MYFLQRHESQDSYDAQGFLPAARHFQYQNAQEEENIAYVKMHIPSIYYIQLVIQTSANKKLHNMVWQAL